ncbi:MAG: NAD(P)/FAD-dependent oxidoreductase [Gemmataceae bacterium]
MSLSVEAVIIGGGPAGCVTALLLARAGWTVALVEQKPFPRRKVCGEYLSATNWPLLDQLGLSPDFREKAGPVVDRVGLFAGQTILQTNIPRPNPSTGGQRSTPAPCGRALSREHLDTWLLEEGRKAGVSVLQPYSAKAMQRIGDEYECLLRHATNKTPVTLRSPIVIAAHGSWEVGSLSTQPERTPPRPSDLFGFKAHYDNSDLSEGLMPLLVFPGGYGGMVHCDDGRVSISLCIRRDHLSRIREGDIPAGEAVIEYVKDCCLGVQQSLARAKERGPWLATGPIRPGIRVSGNSESVGVFRVGNAAGEAHPIVAEGITMAMQGGWLLANHLQQWKEQRRSIAELRSVSMNYAKAWRTNFGPRLRTASVLAQWATRQTTVSMTLPMLRWFPRILYWGAKMSGKATTVVSR